MRKRGAEWAVSALCGLAVLGLLRALAPWLGFALPVNSVSLGVAAVLGLPGIILLLALRVTCLW